MSLSFPWFPLLLLSIVATKSLAITPKNMITAKNTTKPDCQKTCGNITIPYPFGIGDKCYLEPYFGVKCDTSYNPPRAFPEAEFGWDILEITETELKVRNTIVATKCYDSQGNETEKQIGSFETWGSTFTISHTANKLTVIGCDDYALVDFSGGMSQGEVRPWPSAGCFALCRNLDEAIPGSCLGTGCCQVDIPIGLQMGSINLHTLNNRRSIDEELTRVQPCSYAVFAGSDSFRFNGKTDLTNISALKNRTMEQIPLVLNWAVKHNISSLWRFIKQMACISLCAFAANIAR